MKKVVLMIFSCILPLAFLSSCSTMSNRKNSSTFFQEEKPYNSIVKIENSISYTACKINDEGNPEDCKDASKEFSGGSGFAIAKDSKRKSRKIGTAAHLCEFLPIMKKRMKMRAALFGILLKDLKIHSLKVIDDKGETFDAKIKKSDIQLDACILEIVEKKGRKKLKKFPAIHLAKEGPKRGKRYFTAGAPLGVNGQEMTFLTSGLYSGTKELRENEMDFYSIPSAGGSSGSAILNKRGNLVGVLTMGMRSFKEVSISPKFSKVHYFFSQNL